MRLKNVEPQDDFVLRLTWDNGVVQYADLSGLIRTSRQFKIFETEPEAFRAISIINWGHGVAWENGLDYSVENLALIAMEQETRSGSELIDAFKTRYGLTNDQLAQALGYSRNQIKNFRSGRSPVTYTVRRTVTDMMDRSALLYARLANRPN